MMTDNGIRVREVGVLGDVETPPATVSLADDAFVQLGLLLIGGAVVGGSLASFLDPPHPTAGALGGAVLGAGAWFAIRKIFYEEHFVSALPAPSAAALP